MEPSPAAFISALPRSYDDSDYEMHADAEACIAAEREANDAREALRAQMDALRVRLDEADTRVREATLARQLAVSAKLRYDFNYWLGERRVLVGGLSRGCAITYKLSRWQ